MSKNEDILLIEGYCQDLLFSIPLVIISLICDMIHTAIHWETRLLQISHSYYSPHRRKSKIFQVGSFKFEISASLYPKSDIEAPLTGQLWISVVEMPPKTESVVFNIKIRFAYSNNIEVISQKFCGPSVHCPLFLVDKMCRSDRRSLFLVDKMGVLSEFISMPLKVSVDFELISLKYSYE